MPPASDDPGRDEQNLALAEAGAEVDRVNASFYAAYPFPPRAHRLERPLDPDFQRVLLCQDLGEWTHRAVPPRPSIWVAGCGTNQGVATALSFPNGRVVGSDVSATSLELEAASAKDLALRNLELRRESLNDVAYQDEFDYVVCTGVIHHNADPAAALRALARALKPGGVLELMVYGRYQRIPSSCAQKAIRILAGGDTRPGDECELRVAQALVSRFQAPGRMGAFLGRLREARPAELADNLLQPVEHSYTVSGLDDLARGCGLELLLPTVNPLDKLKGNFTWDLNLPAPELQEAYLGLDDVQRWQVANLLLGECSPLLWFYLRRAGGAARRSERDVCESFLETRFARTATRKQAYTLDADGHYRLTPGSITFPPPPDGALRGVVEAADARTRMREVLERQGLPTTFPQVNDTRVKLTTAAFPYLRAVAA